MSKRRSPPGVPGERAEPPITAPLTFTVNEVFEWVCDKQGIRNADHLTDGRWRFLWGVAERTTQKLNALFSERKVMA